MNNTSEIHRLSTPLSDAQIRALKIGDQVLLSGVILTGRDTAHKWMVETFIEKTRLPEGDDELVYQAIRGVLDGGVLYHCGPIVSGLDTGDYQFVVCRANHQHPGGTLSGRCDASFQYQRGDRQGGMGQKTGSALREVPGVYFHAVGGAGVFDLDNAFRR